MSYQFLNKEKIENLAEIIDSDWLKFKPIKIGLRIQNFEKSKKYSIISEFNVFQRFLIYSNIVKFFADYGQPKTYSDH
jgi:hypothetical protein